MANNLLKGKSPDIIHANTKTLMDSGKYTHASALRCAMCHANKTHKLTVAKLSKKMITPNAVKVKVL